MLSCALTYAIKVLLDKTCVSHQDNVCACIERERCLRDCSVVRGTAITWLHCHVIYSYDAPRRFAVGVCK